MQLRNRENTKPSAAPAAKAKEGTTETRERKRKQPTEPVQRKKARKEKSDSDDIPDEGNPEEVTQKKGNQVTSTTGKKKGRKTPIASGNTEENTKWIECEDCRQWRPVPASAGVNLEELGGDVRWVCSMNTWDKKRNRCDIPQELPQIFYSLP